MRKIRLAAAPAALTSDNTSKIANTTADVTEIAMIGVRRCACNIPNGAGRVRSWAMASAIRDAANRFACKAEYIDSTAATMTSQ